MASIVRLVVSVALVYAAAAAGAGAGAPFHPATCFLLPDAPGCADPPQFTRDRAYVDTTCPRTLKTPAVSLADLPAAWTAAFADVQSVLDARLNTVSVPAYFGTIVYRDQVVWSHGAGVRDKQEAVPTPPTLDNTFRIGSISKVWPVLLAMTAIETGQLRSVDESVDLYYPGLQMLDPAQGQHRSFTFRQLASHMAGVPREAPCRFPCLNITLDSYIDTLRAMYLIYPPDTKPSYSNLGSSLLGHVVAEAVMGAASFDAACDDVVGAALGLTSTSVTLTPAIEAQLAVGYTAPLGIAAPLYEFGFTNPSGNMYSSGRDLVRLVVELLKGEERAGDDLPAPQLFKHRDTIRRMLLPVVMIPSSGTDGFGTPFELLFRGGYLVRVKAGNVDGYSSIVVVVPELQLGMTFTYTGSVDMVGAVDGVLAVFLQPFLDGLAAIQPGGVPSPNATYYLGEYVSPEGLGTLTVRQHPTQAGVLVIGNAICDYTGTRGVYAITDQSLTDNGGGGDDLPSSCLVLALQATLGQNFVFDNYTADGFPQRLNLFGIYPGYYFERTGAA